MRLRLLNMILIAVFVGSIAVFAAHRWLDSQADRRLSELQVTPAKPISTQTLVVAAVPLRFGMEVEKHHLREIAWPEGSLPKGAFSRIDEVIDGKNRRVALSAVEENEAVLATKITGPGQRGSLAAVIEPGMKAVTVRVNDVNGVAGFVLPGERVDVLITRNVDKDAAFTDVLLQNVKVLAADQLADELADKPALVKAVTLEATTAQAQKLTLAATVGSLSLTLRSAGQSTIEGAQRIALEDLAYGSGGEVSSPAAQADERRTRVTVTRGTKREDYSVLVSADPALAVPAAVALPAEAFVPALPRVALP